MIVSEFNKKLAVWLVLARFSEEKLPSNIFVMTSLVATHWVAMHHGSGFHVIYHKNEPAGFAFTTPEKNYEGNKITVSLEILYVFKKFRGIGLGYKLAAYITQRFSRVRVAIEDRKLKRFYQSVGFKTWRAITHDSAGNSCNSEMFGLLDEDCMSGATSKKAMSDKYLNVVKIPAEIYSKEILVFLGVIRKLSANL